LRRSLRAWRRSCWCASRAWAEVRNAAEFGIGITGEVKYDFGAAMARMRKLRARISQADSARRYKQMGVDVFIGEGRFIAPDTVGVDGKRLTFSKAAICAGARAAAPPIPGLAEAGCLTNETVFTLTELPRRLAVCEVQVTGGLPQCRMDLVDPGITPVRPDNLFHLLRLDRRNKRFGCLAIALFVLGQQLLDSRV